jgi:hypothetical protein
VVGGIGTHEGRAELAAAASHIEHLPVP